MSDNTLTIKELSERIGISKRTIESYVQQNRAPGSDFLIAMTTHMSVSATWLLTGIGPSHLDDHTNEVPRSSAATDFISIMRYDVGASAGTGSLIEAEVGTGQYAFNQSWLKRRGLNPDDLAVISVRGDSMEPELNDNDLILLDRSVIKPKDGELFVVRYAGDLFVKRVQVMPFGGFTLSSTNKFYSRIVVETGEATDLKFIGKVVASMHEW